MNLPISPDIFPLYSTPSGEGNCRLETLQTCPPTRPRLVFTSLVSLGDDAVAIAIETGISVGKKVKGKGFPYSIPSVGHEADPDVQAVSPQVTVSHPPGSRLPLLSARPAVTSPAAEHHRPLAGTKLYCLVRGT